MKIMEHNFIKKYDKLVKYFKVLFPLVIFLEESLFFNEFPSKNFAYCLEVAQY
jgi:hypothetical protein